MYQSASQRLRRQNHVQMTCDNHGVRWQEVVECLNRFEQQFNKNGGKDVSLGDRLEALGCAIILDNTLLAQSIISSCSLDELNSSVRVYPLTPMPLLALAVVMGNKKMANLLLEAKVNVNALKHIAMRTALGANTADMLELLLDAGATTEFTLDDGRGIKEFIRYHVCQGVIQCLLARNLIPEDLADLPKVIEAKKVQDRLNKAVEQDAMQEVIDCLTTQGAYPNDKVKIYLGDKFQKLAALIEKDDVNALRRLIIQGFPLFICDKQGNTLLHVAAQNCSVRTIGYFIALLKKIGKLDQYAFKRNNSGRTAIDYAANKPQLVRLFLGLEDSKSELDLNLPADTLQLPESIGDSNNATASTI